MPTCARCQKQVDFVQRDYLFKHQEICPNCRYILQRIHISHKSIEQLPCHDCGTLTFLDVGEYEKVSEADHSTTFRCKDCVWQIERNKRIAHGESKLVTVSKTTQYAIMEEIDCRRNWAFQGNGHNFDPDDPDEALQLHFTYSETGNAEDAEELILNCLALHNRNSECQDFYETDWMMFLDDKTDIIDLYYGLNCWKVRDHSHPIETGSEITPVVRDNADEFYCELRYDDPFALELLKLAREKWPVYDADMGRMSKTVQMLREQKIGEIIGTEWMNKKKHTYPKEIITDVISAIDRLEEEEEEDD